MSSKKPTSARERVTPHPSMQAFDRLAGTWRLSGGREGEVTWEWMTGGYFLIGHVRAVQNGHPVEMTEVIGRARMYQGSPSRDVLSRAYDSEGNTLDHVYEIEGDRLRVWARERDSEVFYEGVFNADGTEIKGRWTYPGGGYETLSTRVK